jgi:hypothetical protein
MTPTFTFDGPTSVFKSGELSAQLRAKATQRGPVLPLYRAVKFTGGLHRLTDDQDTLRVLVYQARYLRSPFPDVLPELRVAMPADFGRMMTVVWYAPEFECLLEEGTSLFCTAIHPEEVL